jgi:uncharacterized repeat protein (TIGR03803 family)
MPSSLNCSLEGFFAAARKCLRCRTIMRTRCFVLALGCAAAALTSSAQSFKTLVNFDGANGIYPASSVSQGLDGNFYGTTPYGGATNGGIVFKVTPNGALTTLYSFCLQTNCPDGNLPYAGLVLGTDGTFYGTTRNGGASGVNCPLGECGTVFKITPAGVLTTLHSFTGNDDGSSPYATLIQGTDGNLYGTAQLGGAYGYGTLFRITPNGLVTTLHQFEGSDGDDPTGALLQATDGNFYGTTGLGGSENDGVVFRITPNGTFTRLYSFCSLSGCTDGSEPVGGLIQGSDGDLYGTTFEGGAVLCHEESCGTVFSITLQGTLTTLHSFDRDDGAYPYDPLIQATDGNFCGTTSEGGNSNHCFDFGCGTVFEITPAGTLTTLHSFDSAAGSSSVGGLLQGTDGDFYGTAQTGGIDQDGTVFGLSVGLGPFVQSLPSFGIVGANIGILGTNLTGAISVTFNGVPATFTVKSRSEIVTTVPTGATTGNIQVTTPTATLISNVAFTVEQ